MKATFIFDNTIKDHDAHIYAIFFECKLVNLNTANKKLAFDPSSSVGRTSAPLHSFTDGEVECGVPSIRAFRACPVPLDSGRPCEAANRKIDTDQDCYRKNGTAGSITDVIQHAIIIRNLVGRLFVQKTNPSSH